jgi:hypothetical protein
MVKEKQKSKDTIDTLLHVTTLQATKLNVADKIIAEQDSLITNYKTTVNLNKISMAIQNDIIKSKNKKLFGISFGASLGLAGLITYSILK